ncbi:MAG: hypothetical protein M3Y48_19245 [Actinomycetota bacterium]|nr:hypothetical protein [Actinomycetota bacterium]
MTPSAGGDVDRAVPHFAPGMLAELDEPVRRYFAPRHPRRHAFGFRRSSA